MKKNNKSLVTGFSVFTAFLFCGVFSFAQNPLSGNPKEQIEHIQYLIKQTGAKWTAGETSLSNLSQEEWQFRLGLNLDSVDAPPVPLSEKELPPAIDWRDFNGNYVTGVRNQKKCGSCWAFAMTGALESYVMLTQNMSGADIDLSEQVMVSCSGAGSCSGGYLTAGFLKKTGLPPETYYPYTATDGSCSNAQPGWQNAAYKIIDWGSVSQDLSKIKAALVQYGPLPTAMMVYEDFMHYKSGIYSYVTGKRLGGHAILLVGYNDEEQYFIVKNSWDTKWGEKGFFRIAYSQMDNSVDFGMKNLAYYSKNAKTNPPLKIDENSPVSPFIHHPPTGGAEEGFDTDKTWQRLSPILQDGENLQNTNINLFNENLENLSRLADELSSNQDYSNIQSALGNFYDGSNSKTNNQFTLDNTDNLTNDYVVEDNNIIYHTFPENNKNVKIEYHVPLPNDTKNNVGSDSGSSIPASILFLSLFAGVVGIRLFKRTKPEIDASVIINQPGGNNDFNVNSGNQASTVNGIAPGVNTPPSSQNNQNYTPQINAFQPSDPFSSQGPTTISTSTTTSNQPQSNTNNNSINQNYNPCYPHEPPCITQGNNNNNQGSIHSNPGYIPNEVCDFTQGHFDQLHPVNQQCANQNK